MRRGMGLSALAVLVPAGILGSDFAAHAATMDLFEPALDAASALVPSGRTRALELTREGWAGLAGLLGLFAFGSRHPA